MTGTVTIDFETKSHADLTKVGAWRYSQDPSTEIICLCYGYEDRPIQAWWPELCPSNEMPGDLRQYIDAGALVEAHNVGFEYSHWINLMSKRYGWPCPRLHQWRDTMATACYYGLPAGLDKLLNVLGFEGKDPEGSRLITKYSKLHLKTAQETIPDEDFFKFVDYCVHDVKAEQSVSDYMGDLPEREVKNFLLNLKMNARGFQLDMDGVGDASYIVRGRQEQLKEEFKNITGLSPDQRDEIMSWMWLQGLSLENLTADYIKDLLASGVPTGDAKRALEVRVQFAKASTKKLVAMERCVDDTSRARFQTRYHGAATGRTTGQGMQPLNLARSYDDVTPEQLVHDISYRDAGHLDFIYGDAMEALSKASRHWVTASPGCRILSGDFVSIEAICLAMLAGEQWKIDAFRRGEKIYERMGENVHGLERGVVTKATHPLERQDGKTCELAFGYQGALGAWRNFDKSDRHTDEAVLGFVRSWREVHPCTVQLWANMEDAAKAAVLYPGGLFRCGALAFEVVDEWLSMILPDGKRIWFFKPFIANRMPHYHTPWKSVLDEDGEEINGCKLRSCRCEPHPTLLYWGHKEGQWKIVATYGGKLVENATQATSRQLLEPAKQEAEAAGYPLVLDVYDELVCDVPNDHGSKEEFAEIMRSVQSGWAADYPIGVDVWEGDRYKK